MRRSTLLIGLSGLAIAGIGVLVGYRFGSAKPSPLEAGLLVAVGAVIVAALMPSLRGRTRSASADQVARPERSWDQFRRELDRSRRFGRSFVIARIPAGELRAPGSSRTPHARLAMLPLLVRGIDLIWYSRGTVYVLLPETDRSGMRSFLERLQAATPGLLPSEGITVSQFPDDGLTTGSLLQKMTPEPLAQAIGDRGLGLADDRQAS